MLSQQRLRLRGAAATLGLMMLMTVLPAAQALAMPIVPSDPVTNMTPPGPPARPNPKNLLPHPGSAPTELPARRTAFSRTFLNPDGTFRLEATARPMHFKNAQGNWEAIDNSLVATKASGYAFTNKANAFRALFALNNQAGQLIRYGLDDEHWVAFAPQGRFTSTGVADKTRMFYRDVQAGVDLRYTLDADRLKEELILNRNPGTNTFTFSLASQGLTSQKDADGNICFNDAKTGSQAFCFAKPFAVDAGELQTQDVSMEIRHAQTGDELVVTVDDAWLQNAKYPVVIDPTIQPGPVDSKDTFVSSTYSGTSYYNSTYLHVGSHPTYGQTHSLIEFNYLPSLQPGAQITKAHLDVNMYLGLSGTDGTIIEAHQVLSDWKSSTTFWSAQPSFNATAESSVDSTSAGSWQFDLTNLARKWYQATAPNYGIMLKAKDETMPRRSFMSGDSTGTDQPKLVVEYAVDPLGMEPFWAYAGNVNVHNGNLVLAAADVTLPGKGSPIAVTRTYNSRATAPAGGATGYGWAYNVGMSVSSKDGGVVLFTNADGNQYAYVKNAFGTYTAPAGVYLTLAVENGVYVLEDEAGGKFYFDATGKLDYMLDADGNRTDIVYLPDGNIDRVTDPSGRSVVFGYLNGKLSTISGSQIPTIAYDYDANGNLTGVSRKDAAGILLNKVIYAYDGTHNLTSFSDPESNVTTVVYSADDKVTAVKKQLTMNGVLTTLTTAYGYTPDTNGMTTDVTDPRGIVTRYVTNNQANVEQVIEDYGTTTGHLNHQASFQWDVLNNLGQVTDALGHDTRVDYNDDGRAERVNTPDNNTAVAHFDTQGHLVNSTDTGGRTSVNAYDSTTGHQVGASNPSFATSVLRYDQAGNLAGATIPLGLGVNLLSNHSFENWGGSLPTGWQLNGSGGTVSDNQSYMVSGKHSVQLTATGNTSGTTAHLVNSDFMPVTANTMYNLSWWVKTSNVGTTGSGATVNIHWYDANRNWLGGNYQLAVATGTEDWMRKGARINAPANAVYARVELALNDSGTAWFDSVQLEYGTTINQYNLITNESFEMDNDGPAGIGPDGIPDYWTQGSLVAGDSVVTAQHHTGTRSVLVNGAPTTNKNFYYNAPLAGKAGTAIHFSGWSKAQGVLSTGGYYQVLINIQYTDGTSGWYGANFSKTDHDFEYTERVVAAEKDFSAIAIYGKLENQAGQVWFDDFNLRLDGAPNALRSEYNLAQNGSFEWDRSPADSWPDDWEKFPQNPATPYDMKAVSRTDSGADAAYNGGQMLRIANVPDWATVANTHSEPIMTGGTYSVTAAVKTENVTGGGAVVKFDIYDANGTWLTQKSSRMIQGTNDWTPLTVSLTEAEAKALNSNAALLRATVGVTAAISGVAYFDAVRLQKTGAETTYGYDASGNYVTRVTNALGQQNTIANDVRGNVTKVTDPLGSATNFNYDLLDRMQYTENAAGLRTEFVYNHSGQAVQVTQKDKATGSTLNTVTNTYNEQGLAKSLTDPLGRKTTFEYDPDFNVKSVAYPNSKGVNFTYDALNRLSGLSYTGDTTTWSYTYDANSNRKSMTRNGTQTTSYTYDIRNRLSRVDYPTVGTIAQYTEFQYNPAGQVLNIKNAPLASDPVIYQYDQAGLHTQVTGPNNTSTAFMRDEQGRVVKAYRTDNSTGKAFITYNSYDTLGRLTRTRTETQAGQPLVDFSYTYDLLGNRLKETDNVSKAWVDYTYDAVNRLTKESYKQASGAVSKEISYQYDLLNNRTLKSVVQGATTTTTTFAYDAANQIASASNGGTYQHDGNGNLTFDGWHNYYYNAENQLIQVQENGTVIAQYEYDADGLRTKKIAGGRTELYYYNGNELAYVTDGNNNLKYFFTRDAAGQLQNMIDYTAATPQTYWYIRNGHGDVISLVDKTGTAVVTYQYDAWGSVTASGTAKTGNGENLSDANPFRYAGYQYDTETGFYYLKSRYYTPYLGRFLTADLNRGKPWQQWSNNLYAYVGDNPTNYVDPSGHLPIWALRSIAAAYTAFEVSTLTGSLAIITANLAISPWMVYTAFHEIAQINIYRALDGNAMLEVPIPGSRVDVASFDQFWEVKPLGGESARRQINAAVAAGFTPGEMLSPISNIEVIPELFMRITFPAPGTARYSFYRYDYGEEVRVKSSAAFWDVTGYFAMWGAAGLAAVATGGAAGALIDIVIDVAPGLLPALVP